MIYFILGVSITINIICFIVLYFMYKKITPVFKSTGLDLDFFDKLSDLDV